MNALEQLKKFTRIVADTGDFESIVAFRPIDSTTNPSLLLKAVQNPKYQYLVSNAFDYARKSTKGKVNQLALCLDKLAVNFGLEILKVIPGRVSTEVDARLSFNTIGTIEKARSLIKLYADEGIESSRILIKIASTWEGIRAAEVLEKEGIHTNLTLLFSKIQAVASAEAGIQLISPFVGRILDWHKKNRGVESIAAEDDPGVKSVVEIYNYLKKFGYKTEVMGASFRNTDEIVQLAGCDLLTISPKLLEELENREEIISSKLTPEGAAKSLVDKIQIDEQNFRWVLNEDAMATEKLAEGIRLFTADLIKLEEYIQKIFK